MWENYVNALNMNKIFYQNFQSTLKLKCTGKRCLVNFGVPITTFSRFSF